MKVLSLNILDIVQNSIRAKADLISIEIFESVATNLYRIVITDNGNGIPKELLENVTDPFITTRTKRKMGLGLPLLKYHAELTGGELEIISEENKGTRVTTTLMNNHLDRQPLGDISGVIILMIAGNPVINFSYSHTTDKGSFCFSTVETKEYLETDNLNDRSLLQDIRSMIDENLSQIEASGIFTKEKQV